MQDFKGGVKGDLYWRNRCFISDGSFANKRLWSIVDLKKFDVVPAGCKLWFVENVPFGPTFRILNLSAGGLPTR